MQVAFFQDATNSVEISIDGEVEFSLMRADGDDWTEGDTGTLKMLIPGIVESEE